MMPVISACQFAWVLVIAALCPQVCGAQTPTVAEQYLLAAANQERAAVGLGALHRDPQLAQAALMHARTMADHGGISHQFAGEPELAARGAEAGARFSAISENVGEAPSALRLHDMWMHSAGHRANLLDAAVDLIGISVVERAGQLYAVEDFARNVRTMTVAEQESAVAKLIAAPLVQVDNSAPATLAARQTCEMSTGYAGTQKPWFVMRFTSDSLTALPAELQTRLASGKYSQAAVGACGAAEPTPFTSYNVAVLLYR